MLLNLYIYLSLAKASDTQAVRHRFKPRTDH